ncbi:hypothetical protein [Paraliomyxa miuraensis]|uniref:hypothetical protein n=1 Tax=Paraliomyxa miuraensis TaxID=376150 RepID=UPI00225B8902|nr:hypothetical protein [Paraliomyxa miuraensis]MCX4245964.1 hypothetical protein [Paraliomyxa miuraensis]
MRKELQATFASTAAALFLVGCGKEPPATTPPGGAGAPVAQPSAEGADGLGSADDAPGSDAEVECLGINECAGKSACGVAGSHECGGQNECKGKGWILAPASDCERNGGTEM